MLFLLRRAKIEPLERAVDIGKCEDAIWVPVVESFGGSLMSDNSRNKGGAAFDDIVLRFAPLQRILFFRGRRRRSECGVPLSELRRRVRRLQECRGFLARVEADQRQFDAASRW